MIKKIKRITTLIMVVLLVLSCVACGGEHEHNYKTSYVASTCSTRGYLLNECRCGKKYVAKHLDKLEHRFVDYSYNGDATCEGNGTETAVCSNNGCTERDIRIKQNSAIGHLFVNYVSNGDASCEQDGTKTAICDREGCSAEHTLTEYYSACGHLFVEYSSNGDATYENDGTKTAQCSHLGCLETHTVADVGSKLKHSYTVTIVYNNGTANEEKVVTEGETLSLPTAPQKANYIFTGWFTSQSLYSRFDFSKPITQNTKIYAGYEIDATTLTNKITTNTMKSVVKVYNKAYNENWLGNEKESEGSFGSGFCFLLGESFFLVLTNCHVAVKNKEFDKQSLYVYDCFGRCYDARIFSNAISPDYDLACLIVFCDTSNIQIQELPIADKNINIGEDVIALGSPNGQVNAVSYGSSYNYDKITLSDTPTSESNVTFAVLKHTAFTSSGSSGGPILNSNLEVVGVHYAGNRACNFGFAIPIEKVIEFLDRYDLLF